MMRLPIPGSSYPATIDTCLAGITGLPNLRAKLSAGKDELVASGEHYSNKAREGTLYSIPPHITEDRDAVAFAGLTPNEFEKLYVQYFREPKKIAAREIYDSLYILADEKCPFCYGLGTPSQIDHFLPQSYFPQFSIYPSNLVPSCKDCNMGEKGAVYATNAGSQFIQPYLDDQRFFDTQWVFAVFHPGIDGRPGEFSYTAEPPEDWHDDDKAKVRKHFEEFKLAKKYGSRAGQQLNTVLTQIAGMRASGQTDQMIISVLLEAGIRGALGVNHYQTGMYQALIAYVNDT